jgi:hypothetical protein
MTRKLALLVSALTASFTLSVPGPALGATTIDTTGSGDGTTRICPVWYPDAGSSGQVVTVPPTDSVLDGFTFYMRNLRERAVTLTFRGEVYAWDGAKATGPNLWESAPRTVTFSSSFQAVAFNTGGVPLIAGQQYVLFASISKDYEQNAPFKVGCWGWLQEDVYEGGGFVLLIDFGDESLWTSTPWETREGGDLAFTASFSPALPTSKDQCRNGGWRDYGIFKNQGDCVSFVATGGKNPPGH